MDAGPLLATEPGPTLANPLVAIAWHVRVLVFDERVRTGSWLIGAVLGALLLGGRTRRPQPVSRPRGTHQPERVARPSEAVAQA
jgi:hypothetical protein